MPNKITVCVGDIDDSLSSYAIALDKSARLITSKNFRDLVPGTYYTSIGDLSDLNEFAKVLQQADEIIYCPPKIWSDGKILPSSMKKWTEDYLKVFYNNRKVIGFSVEYNDITPMTYLVDQRKSQHQQIWIAGCSISHGTGVDLEQRYGHLISQKLGLDASFLTLPSSSILWASDQLLRSDLQTGDIVFWGITGLGRLTYWDESQKKIVPCTLSRWNQYKSYVGHFIKEEFFASDILIYQSVNAVMQVVNFCEKVGVRLVLATVLPGMEQYIAHISNFLTLVGLHGRNADDVLPDIGNDDSHPGPKSHQYYADEMLKKYNQLYGGQLK
jgi:hypothetical protein